MSQEYFDLVDENNIPLGKTKLRSEVHLTKTDWHRVVDIWMINNSWELLCQQRSWKKDGNPGMWMSYVGGHMKAGQAVEECVRDELMEELGLDLSKITEQPVPVGMWKSDKEKHFSYRHVLRWNGDIEKDIVFADGEVEQVRWMNISAIEVEIKEGKFCNIINDVIREYLKQTWVINN